ncbi:hypothetical protein JG29_01910 [Bombilactobacillus mellis]|uniref:Uncharacterized protein n=1 Tax=Bombilactobacillus mellis TaxID=1218508 RepID=A0A0F4KX22_9LACO|nr:hypothetical protein [Bombilactobacillus mellis]MBI0106927.1 hypothetical protein [Lactobacillus sp. W8086]MBI0108391.1 hypothetical protein [Lactobacillus sp. W8085]MBI0111609.1 hypothetical protein [Lactobacillus sp. W8088]MBI0115324.1 hypothetical protein [Lactobacillus sp. W8087]MBI0119049.1 hypothetical protein [Lactobacillus sp. W8089]MBI0131014.1 hypothetical protein [Lactobacillus sp. W8090]
MATMAYSEKSVAAFLNFYVHHLRDNDLEILSKYDVDHHVTELNVFILHDRNFRMKDIVPVLMNQHGEIINLLLEDLIANAHLDMEQLDTPQAWENWYRGQKAQIHEPER